MNRAPQPRVAGVVHRVRIRTPSAAPTRARSAPRTGAARRAWQHRPMAERLPPPPGARERLRDLPSVDRLATAVARAELADRRAELLAGAADDADLVSRARE